MFYCIDDSRLCSNCVYTFIRRRQTFIPYYLSAFLSSIFSLDIAHSVRLQRYAKLAQIFENLSKMKLDQWARLWDITHQMASFWFFCFMFFLKVITKKTENNLGQSIHKFYLFPESIEEQLVFVFCVLRFVDVR